MTKLTSFSHLSLILETTSGIILVLPDSLTDSDVKNSNLESGELEKQCLTTVLHRCHDSGRNPGREVGGSEWTLQRDTLLPPWQLELAIQRNKWSGANVGRIWSRVPPTRRRLQIRVKVTSCEEVSHGSDVHPNNELVFGSRLLKRNITVNYSHRSHCDITHGNGPNFPYLDLLFKLAHSVHVEPVRPTWDERNCWWRSIWTEYNAEMGRLWQECHQLRWSTTSFNR